VSDLVWILSKGRVHTTAAKLFCAFRGEKGAEGWTPTDG
jgi:hypothetical protein